MRSVALGVLFLSWAVGSAATAGESAASDSGQGGDQHNSGKEDHRGDPGNGQRDHRDDPGNGQKDHRDDPGNGKKAHKDDHGNHGRYGVYQHPKGYRDHRWVRGERLPSAYYASPYVVVNYRERGWRQPPRGYHWVRVNNDVVLAAIATGIVLEVLINQF